MFSSFFKKLGFGRKKIPAILTINNNVIMVAQFAVDGKTPQLTGFNQVECEPNVIKEGKIFDADSFQRILKTLFEEAKPNAIKANSLLINIPFEFLYPFLKDFSPNATKEMLDNIMNDFVSGNSPIPFNDLSLHIKTFKGDKLTYGVIGVPKNWEDRVRNICGKLGIESCEFISEPYLRLALSKGELANDFSLFSFHGDRVFVSLFHNQILYDSYFLKFSVSEDGQINCPVCFSEFLVSKEDFENQFNKIISNVYFAGFPKAFQKHIGDFIESKGLEFEFINADDSKNFKLFKTDHDLMTLLGLTEKLLQGDRILNYNGINKQ